MTYQAGIEGYVFKHTVVKQEVVVDVSQLCSHHVHDCGGVSLPGKMMMAVKINRQ
jgi:hypothetical protein